LVDFVGVFFAMASPTSKEVSLLRFHYNMRDHARSMLFVMKWFGSRAMAVANRKSPQEIAIAD